MVYRPPKQKPAGPGFPPNRPSADPLEGPIQGRGGASDALKGDERNLVMVDENYVGGDFEDRMWLFWRKQRVNLVRVFSVACVVVIGWQGWSLYQKHALNELQAEYQAATDGAALQAFAQSHPGTTYGKLAQIEAADTFYKDGKYADAVKAYTLAETAWADDSTAQRARFGEAMSTLLSGDTAGGKNKLEAVMGDSTSTENFRAESAYYLALLAAQSGDTAGAAKLIERVQGFKNSPNWAEQAALLSDVLPVLPEIKVVPGAGTDASATEPTTSQPLKQTATAPTATLSKPAAAPTTSSPAASTDALDLSPLQKAAGASGTSK